MKGTELPQASRELLVYRIWMVKDFQVQKELAILLRHFIVPVQGRNFTVEGDQRIHGMTLIVTVFSLMPLASAMKKKESKVSR